ncbi:CgeB family protein [Pedobacter metabolipauper]|uniref:Lipopolysaccharide biosynthesis protein n=1 Tax=Pedobacter metabolipauper TaxID=425513 RepID=A0A4R6T2P6_9SPHI|nr:hypothetical protein [Pedobacter metabolipauper]TDQ11998.1 hypothetical protein ATK78_1128 [Pedobacter metabolipauper]
MTDYTTALKDKLHGKKVLFIGAKFYYFNEEIISKMKKYGAEVTFYYERNVSLKYGIAKNIFPKYAAVLEDTHYKNIIKDVHGKPFDYLFVIRGYKMESWFIEELKRQSPGLKTIMYQWDSIYNWECDYRYLIPDFDVTKTFDYKDAADLGLEYVPTFHTDEFKTAATQKPIYDLFFFGGYSYTRYEFVKRFNAYAKERNIKLKIHLAISLKYYLRERLSGNKLDLKLLALRQLNKQEYFSLFNKSNIIVDYTNPAQTGITMRTLDALGAGKKVLTSNEYIKKEPGYNPEQVATFDPANIHIDSEFLSHQTFPAQDYSIERWLNSIFD